MAGRLRDRWRPRNRSLIACHAPLVACGSEDLLKLKRLFSLSLLTLTFTLAACSTTYYGYSGSGVLVGKGGASTNVNGIDLWIVGSPPRKFTIIGYIEDVRPGGPIPMAVRNSQLAAKAKTKGGDGLLLSSDVSDMVGTFSTANATATGWGSATTFGNTTTFNGGASAFGTGMTMPMIRRTGRYYVIKYVQ
jgi:hypothetical protein